MRQVLNRSISLAHFKYLACILGAESNAVKERSHPPEDGICRPTVLDLRKPSFVKFLLHEFAKCCKIRLFPQLLPRRIIQLLCTVLIEPRDRTIPSRKFLQC